MRTAPTEPERRADGICARRGCRRPLVAGPPRTMPKQLRAVFIAELAADPFCSSSCARAHHRCALPATEAQKAQQRRYRDEMAE